MEEERNSVKPNFRHLALQVGDLIKYDTPVNEIRRAAEGILGVSRDSFPNDSITSVRAQEVFDWLLSLGRARLKTGEHEKRAKLFCRAIVPEENHDKLAKILEESGLGGTGPSRERSVALTNRQLHPEVVRHARDLFIQGNRFHAVFEAAKAYNHAVKTKTRTQLDGEKLMLNVWGCKGGTLKVTRCESDTDHNVQDGVKFLSAGLMRAIRNPAAHEPALEWPLSEEDCLDILSFVSFLFRQLDKAVYVKGGPA